jgi:hypothetical protein
MAFRIDVSDLPTLYTYKEAQNKFNRTPAIRGGDQSLRRLGKQTNKNKWLEHEVRDGIDVYIAGLHNSGLIEYYPTHYNVTLNGWDTISTTAYIHKVAPAMIRTHAESSYIPSGFRYQGIPFYRLDYAGHPIASGNKYSFTYDNKPLGEHPKRIKYAVDRKKMNEVMKPYKPFLQYVKVMHALHGDTVEDINEVRKQMLDTTRTAFIRLAESEDTYWSGYQSLFYEACRRDWPRGWVADLNTMNRKFRDEIKAQYGAELLKEVN